MKHQDCSIILVFYILDIKRLDTQIWKLGDKTSERERERKGEQKKSEMSEFSTRKAGKERKGGRERGRGGREWDREKQRGKAQQQQFG